MLIITAGQSYGLIPALFAGTPVPAGRNSCFIDPGFSGSIKHLCFLLAQTSLFYYPAFIISSSDYGTKLAFYEKGLMSKKDSYARPLSMALLLRVYGFNLKIQALIFRISTICCL